jgi:hypothetical protein
MIQNCLDPIGQNFVKGHHEFVGDARLVCRAESSSLVLLPAVCCEPRSLPILIRVLWPAIDRTSTFEAPDIARHGPFTHSADGHNLQLGSVETQNEDAGFHCRSQKRGEVVMQSPSHRDWKNAD